MKYIITSIAIGSAAFISSCAPQDPDYLEWKRQQQQRAAAASTPNPYGAPAAPTDNSANPYAAPGQQLAQGDPQFQQLPALPSGPSVPTSPQTYGAPSTYNAPLSTGPSAPVLRTIDHTVVSGDTIWGLSKKYNTTQESILLANGLSSATIRVGEVIKIPAE